jgi:predicted nucleic acid-binding protein
MAWLAEVDEDRVFLSTIVFAELRRGVELMPDGRRRARLVEWLADELPARFEGRILPVDRSVAESWGIVMAAAQRAGASLSTMDGFLAATAAVHALTLVTRNVQDFQVTGIALLNPWHNP